MINKKCKACGAVTPVDMQHKLTPYIIKNPPESSKTSAKSKKDKKAKKGSQASLATPETASAESNEDLKEEEGDEEGDDDEITKKIQSEAALLPEARAEDDDWDVDTSEAAVAARMKELQVDGAVAKLLKEDEVDLEGFLFFFLIWF